MYLPFEVIKKVCERRKVLYMQYAHKLTDYWQQTSNVSYLSPFSYGTFVKNPDEVFEYLKGNNIESRPLICGSLGLQPFWLKCFGEYSSFRYADIVNNKGIYLPLHPDMSNEDVEFVSDKFTSIAIPYNFELF